MKKIENKQDRKKKDSRNKTILAVVFVVIMLFGTGGYAFLSMEKTDGGSGNVKMNGLEFVRQGDIWQTSIQGHALYFSYLPNETVSYNIKRTVTNYSGKPFYFTGQGMAQQEILINLQGIVLRYQQVCIAGENCTDNTLPIKNCTSDVVIVREQESGNNFVNEEDNCVYIVSNDSVRDADAFLYKIFGIN